LGALPLLLAAVIMQAQSRPAEAGATSSVTTRTRGGAVYHTEFRGELGKWWQNSDIAKKLQLSDDQISQLDQTFYDHKSS